MATGYDSGFLEKSPNGESNESISNLDKTKGVRASSAPELSATSEGEFCHIVKGRPPKENRCRSCPHIASEATPLISSSSNDNPGQHEEVAEEEDPEEQRGESRCPRCIGFIGKYKNAVVRFRNSKLIHLIQLSFGLAPLCAVIMSVIYADGCPAMARFSGITGFVGIAFVSFWIVMTIRQQRRTPGFHQSKSIMPLIVKVIFLIWLIFSIIDLVFLLGVSPSYSEDHKNYCNKDFYDFSVKRQLTLLGNILVAAVVFLPGFHYRQWCHNLFNSQQPPTSQRTQDSWYTGVAFPPVPVFNYR